MAVKKITSLPLVTPGANDSIPIVQDGVTSRSLYSNLVNKSAVGLGNVDNTSDVDKPISTATQTALNGKQVSGTYSTDIHSNITALNAVAGVNTGDEDTTSIKSKLSLSGAAVGTTDVQTLTNKRITKRVVTLTDNATAGIDADVTDVYQLSAMTSNTTFSLAGTPTDGQTILIRFKDAGAAKNLVWTGFTVIGTVLPIITVAGKWHYVGIQYNLAATAWHVLAVSVEA